MVPRNLLLTQAAIVTVICTLYIFIDMNNVFYIATVVSAQMYLHVHPDVHLGHRAPLQAARLHRPFRFQLGFGVRLVAGTGRWSG